MKCNDSTACGGKVWGMILDNRKIDILHTLHSFVDRLNRACHILSVFEIQSEVAELCVPWGPDGVMLFNTSGQQRMGDSFLFVRMM
jgi:hypothetical protein